jgi:GNAT superfamily N-acetyltransferase
MPQPSEFELHSMTREELKLALAWADGEGWNPGLADADCFHAADPDGFQVGCLADEPVACISVVRYGEHYAFLGFYIVKPEMRGRGYGIRIWQAGLSRLGSRLVGLDGVTTQQENYRKSGFVLAHRNIRFGGVPHFKLAWDPRLTIVHSGLEPIIIKYDQAFFPAARNTFLRCWLRPQTRKGIALMENGTVTGYGVIRACRVGFKIGPLFADSDAGADLMFRALAATANGQPVFIDSPEPNRSATDLAIRHGLSPVFETARMYRGPVPDLSISRTYGITTFELG